MKKLTLALTGLLAMVTVTSTKAQTVDEVVSKYIQAIGGADAWKKVNSVRMEGNLSVQGTDVNITITRLHLKGVRTDIAVMGMNGYTILTPTAGWTFFPFQGQTSPEAMAAEDVKKAQEQLDAQGILLDYKSKGHAVELQGTETIDGAQCFKLKVTLASGRNQIMFIEPKNYYLVRTVATVSAGGQEMEQTINFSNYQKLPEGILVPMTIGQVQGDVSITKYEVNKPVDETIFKAG
jgi:hypothetical protein